MPPPVKLLFLSCIMARTKMIVRSLRSALNIVIIYHIYHQYNLFVMMNNFPSSHSPQSGAMQLVVRWSGPSHGAPPYWLDCRMTLVELCCPVPQVVEHRLHSDQLDHSQSTAGGESGRSIKNICPLSTVPQLTKIKLQWQVTCPLCSLLKLFVNT